MFSLQKIVDIFLISAQNIDCGYTLEPSGQNRPEAIVMSTHNLYFGANVRKVGIPLHTPVSLYQIGF